MAGDIARLESLFNECLSRPESEQAEFLEQLRDEDPGMAERLRKLIDRASEDESLPVSRSSAPNQTVQKLEPEQIVAGRYRIEEYIAEGGMGRVYRARDTVLDVEVALKTIKPEIAANPSALRQFKQEILLARSVTHPNVCRIYDIGLDDQTGDSFLTMEFLKGKTLAARIRESGPIGPEESLPLVRQLADALDAAHRAGVVHRDFKSPNVMLVPEEGDGGVRAVITDFGLADTYASATTDAAVSLSARTEVMNIVGTPAYMSPEQVTGGTVGPASDLYALGIVLFEVATGDVPFRGETPWETAQAQISQPPPAPSSLADVDEDWERAILRLLEKEPSQRFAAAIDLVRALEGWGTPRAAGPASLPEEHDVFVGRAEELTILAEQLEGAGSEAGGEAGSEAGGEAVQQRTRLLTLLGPGGCGKTRLAQTYGRKSSSHWTGGVWFSDLSEARTADGIFGAVAAALEISLGKEDPIIQLGHAIAGRGRCLLILDNFEQVVELGISIVGQWLERAEEVSILVTSREKLRLPQERTHDLEPLDPSTYGLELFEVRARERRPGVTFEGSDREAVLEIVESLDGLPLAIELAAARLELLSVVQIRDRLANRFRILAGGKRGRHSTLEATLDWSWDLLEPWERSAVAQASGFEGGFTVEAAEAVLDLSDHDDAPFELDVIRSLVDKSWLRTRSSHQVPRFDMYMTVKEYAKKKRFANRLASRPADHPEESLGDASNTTALDARHGIYFASMGTREAIEQLDHRDGPARRAELSLELENLIIACRRALSRRDENDATGTFLAAEAVLSLRGPLSLGLELGNETLAVVRDPLSRARVLQAVASFEKPTGETKAAHARFEEAMAIYREIGDRNGEASVRGELGLLCKELGRPKEASEHFEAALSIHRDLGNRRAEGVVLGNIGMFQLGQGRMDDARTSYETALAINKELGNPRAEALVLGNLGNLHADQGRMDLAREHYEAALELHREVGNRKDWGVVLANLGILHSEQGRMTEARVCFERALGSHRDIGNRRDEGIVRGNIGSTLHDQGRVEEAGSYFEAALSIHREVGNRSFEGSQLNDLGMLYSDQGKDELAEEHFRDALALLREIGDRRFEGITQSDMGELFLKQGKTAQARECFESGLAIHREMENWSSAGIALARLGALYGEAGQSDEARAAFEEGIPFLRDLEDHLELGRAFCFLGEFELREGNVAAARAALDGAVAEIGGLEVAEESELVQRVERLRELVVRAE